MNQAETNKKLEAIRSDVSEKTPDVPDLETQKATKALEQEAAKQSFRKRSSAEDAQFAHDKIRERNERRIERFEAEIAIKEAKIEGLSQKVASQGEELGTLRERNDWRKRAEAVFGLMTAAGGVGASLFDKTSVDVAFVFTHAQYFAICAFLAFVGGAFTALMRLLP